MNLKRYLKPAHGNNALDAVGRSFLPDPRPDLTLDAVGRSFLPDPRPDLAGAPHSRSFFLSTSGKKHLYLLEFIQNRPASSSTLAHFCLSGLTNGIKTLKFFIIIQLESLKFQTYGIKHRENEKIIQQQDHRWSLRTRRRS